MKMFFILLALITKSAWAEKVKKLPQYLSVENKQYTLCKEHTIKYAYFIKIANVGLYLKNCSNKKELLNVPDKLIRFNYLVNVKASVFIEAADKFFTKNLNDTLVNQDINELQRFNQLYENIQASEYYDIYHQQGQRLKLFKNNKFLGSSDNSKFSYNYFNIWLGKYPAVKPLKKSFNQ
jgi:hypothetical protein